MPYVRFTGDRHEETGDWESIDRYEDGGGAVGIVTELRDGLEEIDASTYATERAAIIAHNEALPAPEEPVTQPTPQQVAVEAVRAIDLDVIKDADTKAVIKALRDAVLGEPQAEEFSVIETEGAR